MSDPGWRIRSSLTNLDDVGCFCQGLIQLLLSIAARFWHHSLTSVILTYIFYASFWEQRFSAIGCSRKSFFEWSSQLGAALFMGVWFFGEMLLRHDYQSLYSRTKLPFFGDAFLEHRLASEPLHADPGSARSLLRRSIRIFHGFFMEFASKITEGQLLPQGKWLAL